MKNSAFFGRKLEHLCSPFYSIRTRIYPINHFWIHLCYFITFSLLGYVALKFTDPRDHSSRLNNLDVFFTSVSAATVSSMSTVEMEVFSNSQLVIMAILMLFGGEVFTSFLGLQFSGTKFTKPQITENGVTSAVNYPENEKPDDDPEIGIGSLGNESLKYKSIKCLGYVVLGYLLVVHVLGSTLVSMYVSLVPSARDVLKKKGLKIQTFSLFTIVSTFTNCGFVPTNENMMAFSKNSGLLLLLIPQILLGNTLYPACLRLLIWVLEKLTKRKEFLYMLRNHDELGYSHLLSGYHSLWLVLTVLGFILFQFVVFCSLEWNSEALNGLGVYEKAVGSLFQVVNSRHAGEAIVDLSVITPAILVLFIVMMYLPPYTSFIPTKYREEAPTKCEGKRKQRRTLVECLLFSQLSYLVIFIILICVTERHKLKEDPLNFNVLNITIEVISAYGNVGFSICYSCKRQIKPQSSCKDKWYGFVGSWSSKGKLILLIVMFFGRLKKFNMSGGKAWKLL